MIRTARLTLRPARPDDLDDLHAIFSNPSAMRYWDRPAYDEIEPTQRFLDWFMTPDPYRREEYMLEYQGRCIGKAGMWRKPEVGYILHPDFWGMGLAREAMQAVIPRCFDRFADLDALSAEVDPRNAGSIGLLTRLGFTRTALREKDFDYGGIEWCDTAVYTLPRVRTAP
ncbi:GNAT family N-acetyltransferase [Tropicibacter oceani]|uniref:GNAT family N-acetyltransferase n=1 Tax=Tropicibacter oceani TaxID=3058420 RepID=A0ABY8QFU7_9RHOB|nr:GNAT family N-acetyltransferase [Tropicibacter oceani]WGW02886.1 GNAT family N-acetyltransferase [Tropicibacter oceani]